jgi:sulfite reductase (ferredoxin)
MPDIHRRMHNPASSPPPPQGKFYQFMMRTRQPSGLVTNRLYLVMDDLADKVGAVAAVVVAVAVGIGRCGGPRIWGRRRAAVGGAAAALSAPEARRTCRRRPAQYGNGTLRLTTRQAYQLHGVLKTDLKTVFSTVIKNLGAPLFGGAAAWAYTDSAGQCWAWVARRQPSGTPPPQ